MKNLLVALAITLSLPAFAQSLGADSQATGTGSAQVGDIGITSIMQLPGASPYTRSDLVYGGGYRVSGMPVQSAPSSFASGPAWRCTGAGNGGALQLRDFAFSLALGGDDKNICATEFRMAVSTMVAEQKTKNPSAYVVNHALACGDDALADAFEKTPDMKCDEPTPTARKERWDRERAARTQHAQASQDFQPLQTSSIPGQPIWLP